MSPDELKYEVALGSRILEMIGLATGIRSSMGHVSLRDPLNPDRFVVKGRGYEIDVLRRMRPENMVICDLSGRLVDGPPGVVQCNEVMIHACVLKARSDVNSVVHVHPPFSVMLTVMGLPIVPMVLEGIGLVRKPLPVYPHTALVTSIEKGEDMTKSLGTANAVHLLGHGVTTVGKTMEDAVMNAWHLEHQAQFNYYAKSIAGPVHAQIPDVQVEEFLQWRPLAEPHFQEAVARVGKVNTGGSMWSDLRERAAKLLSEG
ncbi:class II aldolase/adducin family protein [Afipia sp. GAS231]|uniref:class II aldolase/adducin family protein n=1 Tax=Afipia sp. GAS231 TaxID=1882747 RepID=UPI00087BBDFD|nr:class II aldolase/adducin family protein [Afipia sp. GAS231]SDO54379.1 L-fuculose-phosphate aldolase [Afipia sp. GAS231]